MRARIIAAAVIGLVIVAGVVFVVSLRPANEQITSTPSSTRSTTAPTTPTTPTTPDEPDLPDGEGRVVAGNLSVLVPDPLRGVASTSTGINQVTLLTPAGADRASVLWALSPARSLSELAAPVAQRIPGDKSSPSIRTGRVKVAGMPGLLIRLDYPLYKRARVVALARKGGYALTIQAVVPQGQAAEAEELVRTLARTTVVRLPRG